MSIKRDINDINVAIANSVEHAVVDGLVVKVDKNIGDITQIKNDY